MKRRSAWWRRWILAASVIALLLGAGCQQLFEPLRDTSGESMALSGGESSLLRLAVGWEADALATDLVAAYRSYRPGSSILTNETSSASALRAVASGAVDLALMAAVDDASLAAQLSEEGGASDSGDAAPHYELMARDGLAIIASDDAVLTQISSAELAALFRGETDDWSALGTGSGRPALAVQVAGSTGRQVFDDVIMIGGRTASTAVVLPNDRAVLEYVQSHMGAIGYVAATEAIDGSVDVVAVDRVLPTQSNIERGDYALRYGLYAVWRGQGTEATAEFIEYVRGGRGQNVVRLHYALP